MREKENKFPTVLPPKTLAIVVDTEDFCNPP
jgi:hypothetical protein